MREPLANTQRKEIEEWLQNLPEPQMRLNDDIQPSRADEAVCTRKAETQLIHHFGNTNRG